MPPLFRKRLKPGAPELRDPKRIIKGTTPHTLNLAELAKLRKEPRLKVKDNQLLIAFGPGHQTTETWHTLDEAIKMVESALPDAAPKIAARYRSVIDGIKELQANAAMMSELPLTDERLMTFAQARQRLADKAATQSFLQGQGNPHFEGRAPAPPRRPVKEGDVQAMAQRTKDRTALLKTLYKNKLYKGLSNEAKKTLNKAVTTGKIPVTDAESILRTNKNPDANVLQKLIDDRIVQNERNLAVRSFRRDVSGSPNIESKLAEVVPPAVPAFIDEARNLLKTEKSGKDVAEKIRTLFTRIDSSDGITLEQRKSIKNRVVEMLMRSNFGDDTLRELAKSTTQAGGRMVQDREGKLIPAVREDLSFVGEGLASLKKLLPSSTLTRMDLQAEREGAALQGEAELKSLPGPADINPQAQGTNPLLALLRPRGAGPRRTSEPRIPEVIRRGLRPYRPSTSNPTAPLPLRSEVREMIPQLPSGLPAPATPEMGGRQATGATKDYALVQAIQDMVKGLQVEPQRWREFSPAPTYRDLILRLRANPTKSEVRRILDLLKKGLPAETYQEIMRFGTTLPPTPLSPPAKPDPDRLLRLALLGRKLTPHQIRILES